MAAAKRSYTEYDVTQVVVHAVDGPIRFAYLLETAKLTNQI